MVHSEPRGLRVNNFYKKLKYLSMAKVKSKLSSFCGDRPVMRLVPFCTTGWSKYKAPLLIKSCLIAGEPVSDVPRASCASINTVEPTGG